MTDPRDAELAALRAERDAALAEGERLRDIAKTGALVCNALLEYYAESLHKNFIKDARLLLDEYRAALEPRP